MPKRLATPDSHERMAGGERGKKWLNQLWRDIGATAASFTLAAGILVPEVVDVSDPSKNVSITTAAEMVLPAGTVQHNGVPQAERFYDEATLARSRQAFEAYFRGDTAELRAQAEHNNYTANWITQAAIRAVESASTTDELHQAYTSAMNGLPITFDRAEAESPDILASLTSSMAYTPANNLELSKQSALATISVLNTMNRPYLMGMPNALRFVTVGGMEPPSGSGHPKPDGIMTPGSIGGVSTIVLSERSVTPFDELAAHEFTHWLSFMNNSAYDQMVSVLNPSGHGYAGWQGYRHSSTIMDGNRTTFDVYGNINSQEDLAIDGQHLLIPHPVEPLDTSTLTEKTKMLIFALEQASPGFTASLLQRLITKRPSEASNALNMFLYTIEENKLVVGSASGLILTWMLLNMRGGRRRPTKATPLVQAQVDK